MNLLPFKIIFLAPMVLIVFFWIAALNFQTIKSSVQLKPRHEDATHDSVLFQLFTRKNPDRGQPLTVGDVPLLEQSNYNSSLATKIFVHGYGALPSQGYSSKDAYLLREDCNFISVDWTALGSSNYVLVAVNNIPIAGSTTGAFVDFLCSEGTPLDAFHLIGFSMGAHIVGHAGAYMSPVGFLPRITGLDPAEHCFSLELTENRLDTSDASFVDVIHTSDISYRKAVGHADFYANGGILQPGCSSRIPDIECCSHCRAVDLFAESINSPLGFKASLCDSWESYQSGRCNASAPSLMGEPTPTNSRGIFYLTTNSQRPFARN